MFLYSHWLKLPLQTRVLIADNFGLIKKGSTEVFNNEVIKDGYVIADIEAALNIDAIQKFLSTGETDFAKLWENLVARIEGREPEIVEVITVSETIIETIPAPEEEKEVATQFEVSKDKDTGEVVKIRALTDKEITTIKRKGRPAGSKNKRA